MSGAWGLSKAISPVITKSFDGTGRYTVTVELGSLTTVAVSGPVALRTELLRAAMTIAAAKEMEKFVRRVAYEPIGDAEATDREVLDLITSEARHLLAPSGVEVRP